MAGTSPTVGNLFVRQLQTPSPYSLSVTSTRWGSRPQMELSSLFLRFSALVLCFVSAITLVTQPAKRAGSPSSFTDSPELMYCLIVSIVTFFYSALQLFKGVCDISHGAVLIPDRISDYLSFILNQSDVSLSPHFELFPGVTGDSTVRQCTGAQEGSYCVLHNVVCSFLDHGCLRSIVWLQAL